MKKKLLLFSVVVTLLMIFAMPVCAGTYNGLSYEISSGEVTIISCEESLEGSIEIPSYIDNYPVTKIGDFSFAYCGKITNIVLPNGIQSIGSNAFSNCISLTQITLPSSVSIIDNHAFRGCFSLTNITVPNSVKKIGMGAFGGCSSLKSIEIPNSVASIENETFMSCVGLERVIIPNSIKNIGDYAFFACNELKNVALPNSVTSIGAQVFSGSGLKDIVIPNSVTNIGRDAFGGCVNLSNITVSSGNPAYVSIDGILFNKNKTEIIRYPEGKNSTRYSIPTSVTSIGDYSFAYCNNLENIIIPDSVNSIGKAAFIDCKKLTNITIPVNVIHIKDFAFSNCINLKIISLPSSVTDIGESAFENCIELKSVTILNKSAKITDRAFLDCENLTIYGYSGSSAEIYAEWWDIPFKTLSNSNENMNGSVPPVNVYFIDVKSNAYYFEPVSWAVANGITSGTSATTFSPDNACTRGQAVTFLWRAAGKPAPKSSHNPFTDVKPGQYYYDAVLWAVENGVTNGTSATTFSPDATCNRGQIVTFLYRAEGEPEVAVRSTFGDVKTDAYYAKAVTWAVNEEVTSGTSATTFSPDNDCTRGQIVTFLYRANK